MINVFEAMLRGALDALNRGDRKRVTETARMDKVLDRLDTAIKEYLTSLDSDALSSLIEPWLGGTVLTETRGSDET
jgi:phosphate:Na+ symporter